MEGDGWLVFAFMMPSVAALLGRWFWWPIKVRSRPVRRMRPSGSHERAGEEGLTAEVPVPAADGSGNGRSAKRSGNPRSVNGSRIGHPLHH